MRILHTADWHLGKNLDGQSRLKEQELFLQDFVKIADDTKADVIVIAGDIYDSVNPPAKAEKLFYDTLKKLSPSGERLILVIAGNHDNPERLTAAGPLAMEHGIVMAGMPDTVIVPGEYGRHQIVESGQGYIKVDVCCQDGGREELVALLIPYPSEKRLSEIIYQNIEDERQNAQMYSARMEKLFRMLEMHFKEECINLVCAHVYAMGSVSAGSERSMTLGNSYLIDGRLFPRGADYIALGHIHKPQIVPGTEHRARYAGAPIHYHKDEAAYRNVCLLVEIESGIEREKRIPQISEIPIPDYKPIEIWHCSSIEDALLQCELHANEESYVYLEIETDRYIREDEMKEMKHRKQDILEIKPILKKRYQDRTEHVSLAGKCMADLFQEFYIQEKGTEISKETMQMFLDIVGEEQELEADSIDA